MAKFKTRPSFKELLAKYEKEGAVQKQKERQEDAKSTKSMSTSKEKSNSHLRQGNGVVTPNYEPIAP